MDNDIDDRYQRLFQISKYPGIASHKLLTAIKTNACSAFVLFVLSAEDNTAAATHKPSKLTPANSATVASTIPGLRIRDVLDGVPKLAGRADDSSGYAPIFNNLHPFFGSYALSLSSQCCQMRERFCNQMADDGFLMLIESPVLRLLFLVLK
ncbi:hypothetical protein ONS95_008906 [Cadophora gregata]|uniref:uncharacterized protein n=1 Tax=Cadophora gregata TaxID=51156 RepID=UPI0026DC6356|nr:uncharacterized protein ONS95_008906 [Cadophora gregata]KAK0123916.1 hypothetical protein ONS95_008906 [Cadophora gregata]